MSDLPLSAADRMTSTLVLGWGNPGRLDDGLGPAFVEAMREYGRPEVDLEVQYQLQIEQAERISEFERVVFVDADSGGPEPFSLRRLRPAGGPLAFTTHSVAPESILALSRDLFGAEPEAWLLGIRGYAFDDFGEELSAGALANLASAVEHVRSAIESNSFLAVRPGVAGSRQHEDSRGA